MRKCKLVAPVPHFPREIDSDRTMRCREDMLKICFGLLSHVGCHEMALSTGLSHVTFWLSAALAASSDALHAPMVALHGKPRKAGSALAAAAVAFLVHHKGQGQAPPSPLAKSAAWEARSHRALRISERDSTAHGEGRAAD